jgi:hypothetical protein
MAIAPVSVPQYPAVPQAPGVPPMIRVFQALDVVTILAADAALIAQSLAGPSWGIFDQTGTPVIIGDAVVAFDFRREYRISDYPVEAGGFASYDKVATPADVRITFAFSGKGTLQASLSTGGALGAIFTGVDPALAGRTAYLTALETAAKNLTLYTVITPEYSYPSVNIVHFDYRREAKNGATLITVDVWLQEVRVTATTQFTQTQMPAGADPVSSGGVQPTAPTTVQSPAIAASAVS